jgi:tRNA (guanine26-N2/guanine27-N2)-dimethyltransferase
MQAKANKNSKVLDATGGTGIRGIRYMLESKANEVTILDMNPSAVRAIKANASLNDVKPKILKTSFQEFSNSSEEKFDFIDIDPFGGLHPYVYDAMKIAKGGTYLMLTATDTAVLCGAHKEACVRLYGAIPLHNELCHEAGIRILINYIIGIAAQFNFGIEVSIAVFQAHYFRIFIKLVHGSKSALESIGKCGYAVYCESCKWRSSYIGIQYSQTKCGNCGSKAKVSGRMWLGSLCNKKDAANLIRYFENNIQEKSEVAMMKRIGEEYDTPFFYSIPVITKSQKIPSVSPASIIEKLKARGYVATYTHFDPDGIKTNAGINEMVSLVGGSH